MHGLTGVRKSKQRELCVAIGRGNFAITKLSHLHTLVLVTERRQICGSQEPTVQIDQISMKGLWDSLDNVFTKQKEHNIRSIHIS